MPQAGVTLMTPSSFGGSCHFHPTATLEGLWMVSIRRELAPTHVGRKYKDVTLPLIGDADSIELFTRPPTGTTTPGAEGWGVSVNVNFGTSPAPRRVIWVAFSGELLSTSVARAARTEG
eukprot:CAMPEP_0202343970 /NCGR_PEP_ID=MMETSP1126-20121109/3855_1 /ASSEMBLY_ACC=CAM_ASM_000457 /TAXON_ID=3047 /ORGANISM="Dunaliella tertiolecta, Strain CCMP1320" /LENGTH=118 /DNA_ID=CAMNT_0048935099 /DNA_START=1 /DNA_END=357 /DNA_ORIENTATION=-